jgi:hypothetical protein
MHLAWCRLRVPEEFVQWLSDLDEEGLTFFLSPFMANKLQIRTDDDIFSSTEDNHLILDHLLVASMLKEGSLKATQWPPSVGSMVEDQILK